ncbi:anti-sigma-F factor Fin [Halanaerobacter jeridensis]|uniref:Nucleic-acid-binding Zn-ribbon protein n=1 Tax=Halanaerobacter jeridensis TaxID=706427 RepID=A0A938XXP5_9FIRM|nr:anti-sigma-F factor Fin [Halanaerobacter jeridensis]MBM7557205.1 putative nucleic-acid-binding Zn-ribbon protein [Halanaerobacter jeridensis]
MKLIYRCSECGKVIDYLELASFDEQALGFNILTEEEKKDIIDVKEEEVYINLTCNQCLEQYNWEELIYMKEIH